MGEKFVLTVDQHHLALDDAIGTSPVLFLGEVEGILPRVSISLCQRCRLAYLAGQARRGCDSFIVGVDVEASCPASAVARAVTRGGSASLDVASHLKVNVAVGRWSSRDEARGQEAHGQRDGARDKPHDDVGSQ